jgi:hypothetical protein
VALEVVMIMESLAVMRLIAMGVYVCIIYCKADGIDQHFGDVCCGHCMRKLV